MGFGFLSEDLKFFCKIANTRLFVKSWGTEGVGENELCLLLECTVSHLTG